MIYWLLPNGKVPARAVLPAAIIMGLLSEALKYAYILALPWLNFQEVYGPFALSVSMMFWAFLSGLLLLLSDSFLVLFGVVFLLGVILAAPDMHAAIDERAIAATVDYAKRSTRFDKRKLPEETARKLKLLKLSLTIATPADTTMEGFTVTARPTPSWPSSSRCIAA